MKRLLAFLALFFVSSLSADISVDSIRQTSYDYACVDGAGKVLSPHQRQDKASAACLTRKLADPNGVYQVQGGRWRIDVTGANAQQGTLIGGVGQPGIPQSPTPPQSEFTSDAVMHADLGTELGVVPLVYENHQMIRSVGRHR